MTCFIIELATLSSLSVSAKTTDSLINAICLDNRTRNYLIEKGESSSPSLLIITANFKASNALLTRLKHYALR